ncbi:MULTISPECIES: 3'-5' exonuclease [unclassified Janthinobacterium]|jgi:ribonuclease D|uniref:3'-5' exonuclease n=1 Tax=unclassified Janthinobacterium TaxID=2610881 RepID=UPI001615647A|nr:MULTISPECIES: 3'-5' exonuclease [unclassified Janthinobacterium]MBB5608912.1 RNA polymerase sigma factor for flagellar operon FliA [Janthinobacterium sp. S3T4]MBB5615233.1 RNA polymerase sigma factor for flagellar operon FliA [Janthinobacterium sp. S3M3]
METAVPPPLPPYQGIQLAQVKLVRTSDDAREAMAALLAADAIGFDTESKPTFVKGESSTGPHLIQLATDDIAYLFQVGVAPTPALAELKAILESTTTIKVGFGLSDDVKRLRAKLGIMPAQVLDLSVALRGGQRNDLGAKTAVAKFFGQHLQKSKKISTTNWASTRLTDKQILYAADDAQVALRVYRRWIAEGGKVAPQKAPRPAPLPQPAV